MPLLPFRILVGEKRLRQKWWSWHHLCIYFPFDSLLGYDVLCIIWYDGPFRCTFSFFPLTTIELICACVSGCLWPRAILWRRANNMWESTTTPTLPTTTMWWWWIWRWEREESSCFRRVLKKATDDVARYHSRSITCSGSSTTTTTLLSYWLVSWCGILCTYPLMTDHIKDTASSRKQALFFHGVRVVTTRTVCCAAVASQILRTI